MSPPRKYCTFFLAGHCCGVPVEQVQEVLRHHQMTRVPLAPPEVRGLINLRGQIVMVIDLRRRLNLPDRTPQQRGTNVVVWAGDEAVSFLVDEMGDVRNVDATQFESPPDTLRGVPRRFILGTYKLKDRLLLALDVEKAADVRPDIQESDRTDADQPVEK